jgi:hypothetical protein
MNIGLVSNLGMISNIGGVGTGRTLGSISHLGTMSKLNFRTNFPTSDDKIKEMLVFDDRFDCIRETQSIINSNIFSKKYIN